MTDYSIYPRNARFYTGTERKFGITVKGKPYIVKFRRNSKEGYRFSHVSEYLGSHIFNLLGVSAQESYLGLYNGEEVVCVRDFLEDNEIFVPFNGVGDSSLEEDKEKYQYDYVDIMRMLRENIKLTNVHETVERFWEMFIVDAFLGNFDRHGSNWGFIKKENRYRIAPVFDNGSCLFPQLNTDEKLDAVMSSSDEMDKRVFTFPTSQVKLDGRKSSYYEVISSLRFEECNRALIRITERMQWHKVDRLINETPFISVKRKEFYGQILKARYDKILRSACDALTKYKEV